MRRTEFEKVFLPFNESGKQVWVITKIKKLPDEIVQMALNLATLNFIKYVRISEDILAASSENYPKRPKVPVTSMHHETAIGIELLYDAKYKSIDFNEINSPVKGDGSKMVDAVLKDFPKDWRPAIVIDWSNGFWGKMKKKYNDLDWIV